MSGLGTSSWTPPADAASESLEYRWYYAAHETLKMISGADNEPETLNELKFSCVVFGFGLIVISVVIGMAGSMVEQIDLIGRKKTEQIESLLVYLQYRKVPKDIRSEVRLHHSCMIDNR